MRVCARAVLNEVAEDGLIVVSNNEDLVDLGKFGDGSEAVRDDGVAGDFEEWLHLVNHIGRVAIAECT